MKIKSSAYPDDWPRPQRMGELSPEHCWGLRACRSRTARSTFGLQQAGLIAGSGQRGPDHGIVLYIDRRLGGRRTQPAHSAQYFDYLWLGHDGGGDLLRGVHVLRQRGQPDAALAGVARFSSPVPGSLIISPPATFPANAAGMTVFVGTVERRGDRARQYGRPDTGVHPE